MSIHTRVITKTEDPYPIIHLVYHGNSWQIQRIVLLLGVSKPGRVSTPYFYS